MKRLQLPLALALLPVLAAGPMPAAAEARTPAKRMVDAINWWRGATGRAPLYASRSLRRSSERRARQMMRGNFFAHPRRLRVPGFRTVGEVLALHAGKRPGVGRTLRRWSRSPGHRQVLMSSRLRGIGAARVSGRWRGQRATIWVVRLGRR